jgi:hypothetical protein
MPARARVTAFLPWKGGAEIWLKTQGTKKNQQGEKGRFSSPAFQGATGLDFGRKRTMSMASMRQLPLPSYMKGLLDERGI